MSAWRKTLRQLRDHPWVLPGLIRGLRCLQFFGIGRTASFYRHVPYRGVVAVPLPERGLFRMQASGGHIENEMFWRGVMGHEPTSMGHWLDYAKGARTVLDIGCNSGLFGLVACAAGATAVHAFEPVERIADLARRNGQLSDFPQFHVWNLAVGAENGEADMLDPGGDAPTSASLSAAFARNHLNGTQYRRVRVVRIDDWMRDNGVEQVDLVKLDVEGYEEYALLGMTELVSRWQPVILIEVLEEFEADIHRVVEQVCGQNYSWQRIQESDGSPSRNVLLVPSGKA